MSNFWPSGIDLSDTQSPKEILKVAQEEWHQSSGGLMELVLQDATSTTGNIMIVVHAKHVVSNRTSTLFSIVHRPDNNPYPVRIQLEKDNLPDSLRKTYSTSGYLESAAVIMAAGRTVTNYWVSDTPTEFRKKLAEAFNEGSVKGIVVNLTLDASNDTNEDHQEDPKEI
jgi:hypothetical protein